MKISIAQLLTLLLLFFLLPENHRAQENNSGSLFIIGGGQRPVEMVERLIKESGVDKKGYGIILPFSSAEQDSAIWYARRQFSALGVDNVSGIIFDSLTGPSKPQLDSLRNASLIYITGGDQDRFMRTIANTPVAEIIHQIYKEGGMIAGTSAGAAVISEQMITGTELKHPEYYSTFRHLEPENLELKKGLGLIKNVIIDQHFVRRSRYNRLLSAVIEYPDLLGIGIDEATAILVKGDEAEVVGNSQVVVISNPGSSSTGGEEKLAGRGIHLDIYLNGEKFRIK